MGTFGSDRYSPNEISAAVSSAIRFGYRFFDCASVYGNEDLTGKAFKEAIRAGAKSWEDIWD